MIFILSSFTVSTELFYVVSDDTKSFNVLDSQEHLSAMARGEMNSAHLISLMTT